jgi:type 1 glutamine amidotransferase/sugar phosphate isomerase/epimerase
MKKAAAVLILSSTALVISAGSLTSERPPLIHLRMSVAGLLGWRIGIPAEAPGDLTVMEAADKAKAAGLGYVEGFSTQKVSAEIAKTLDFNLAPEDVSAIKAAFTERKIKMPAYRVDLSALDESSQRKVFTFAKSLDVDTLISGPLTTTSLAAIDKLANEFSINVAIAGNKDLAPVQASSKRIGIVADLAEWMRAGVKPVDGLRRVSGRLMVVNLRDRNALGKKGHAVPLGTGAAGLDAFLMELNKLERPESLVSPSDCGNCSRALVGIKPLFLAVELTSPAEAPADLSQSLVAFDKALRPAMGDFVDAISRATPITSPDTVPAEDKQKIAAALPHTPPAKPLKPRKLLVLDLCPAGGYYHTTIAYANFALGLMGKNTGAYEATFSNDLDNLKYPRIKRYDAVFLNSTVGEDFVDADVLNGLLRFVREGGGLAGIHGATYASMDLPEFGELIGAQDGPHKVETAVLKVDDPNSPVTKPLINSALTQPLGGEEFSYTDEFYHFLPTGPYSRSKLHVLLSIDTQKSDMSNWKVRPDNDYGLSWIRSYGKGRVFNCAMGHTPTLFETPALADFILSGIQYVLGDLPADSTPSVKLMSKSESTQH